MLLAALDLPFSDDFHDTERFIARIESEVASKEFDVLVLPAQPYARSPGMHHSQMQRESQTHVLVNWICAISRQKRALVVCGTSEWTKEPALYRTALASYDGRLVARHVMWPDKVAFHRTRSFSDFSTPVCTPMCTAAILLDADLVGPLSLAALCQNDVSICLVSSLWSNSPLVDIAGDVAARFGLFVVLAGCTPRQPDEPNNGGSVIVSPMGNVIAGRPGDCRLLLVEVPDVHGWTNTSERDSHRLPTIALTQADDWPFIRRNNLRERDGFYCP
ncbi:hypothetical protein G2912_21415 [Paraburkholderia aspalathi]|uniref:CN hydrolase domain-containing protein n=1 Tax=Paraburkholderia nemoris TaxID=2793076 RepID=A0ABN7M7T2_9BURK|nr:MULTISPECIES: hypothetical protein [Paraburkholderia]MBK3812919.1 hypothetical protein [Paraburkholderia aspalathi]CAE6788912.1 hypothetical protein R69776_04661 [Paraburkholderia nemoris]